MAHINIQQIIKLWTPDATPAQEKQLASMGILAIAEQMEVANALAALKSPGSLLVDETLASAKTDAATLRVKRINALRATVREGLGL